MKALVVAFVAAAAATTLASPVNARPPTGTEVATLSQNTVDGVDYVLTRGCRVDAVYATGAAVKEGVGPGFVHNSRNEGTTPLVMEIAYINPVGTPRSVEVPEPPGCPVR